MLHSKKLSNWLPNALTDVINGSEWLTRVTQLTTPSINILENEREYILEFAIPGIAKNDIKINISDDNCLVVSVSKKEDEDEPCMDENDISCKCAKNKHLRCEFSYANFSQTLVIPSDVDKENINAKCTDGILTMTLPKIDAIHETNSKEIKIY